ncbi:glycosyltransferase family 4 protein [Actinoplanes sp. NPDC026619]|uniref:glycosyltransferase family 4 protein n=1 Tax=Actinoplanes sp. NPDC026619 TaxID=3155798 RepID=UPI0033E5ACF0
MALELAERLQRSIGDFSLVSGSWPAGPNAEMADARKFFSAVRRLSTVDYTPDPAGTGIGGPVPMHPSFEYKEGVPDRVLSALTPAEGSAFAEEWRRGLAASADESQRAVLHLHHLGPMNVAARRIGLPVVAHLHGTEMKFFAEAKSAAKGAGRWSGHPSWAYAGHWVEELQRSADEAAAVLCVSQEDAGVAAEVFGLPDQSLRVVENGVETDRFHPLSLNDGQKLRYWVEWLVRDPQGWDGTMRPGSVSYDDEHVRESFIDRSGRLRPVLLCVSRFLRWKRLTDVIDAYVLARDRHGLRSPLVIWGGYPGECEGINPYEYARSKNDSGIFFTGWRGLDDLKFGYAAADLMVNGADSEPFGTAILQAMSTGTPVLSTRTGGPTRFIEAEGPRQNGWFFELGDVAGLARQLTDLTADVGSWRQRLAPEARQLVLRRYSWERVVAEILGVYDDVLLTERVAR